jgi:integrase
VLRLLDHAEDTNVHALLYTAIYTGLRRSELLGLRWQDLDLDRGQAAIVQTVQRLVGLGYVFGEPKTAKGRRQVALPKTVREVLRRHRVTQAEDRLRMGPVWNDCGLVFTNPTGGPMDPSALTRRFQRLLKAAGLTAVRFHDLRHTHATLMLKQGVHPKIVSERLGHATIAITLDTYSHVLPGLQDEAARQLDEWLTVERDKARDGR